MRSLLDSMLYLTDADIQKTMTVVEAVDLADRGILPEVYRRALAMGLGRRLGPPASN